MLNYFRVVIIQSGPEFPPEFRQGAAENDLRIELLTEGENTETPVKETPGNFINALKPK